MQSRRRRAAQQQRVVRRVQVLGSSHPSVKFLSPRSRYLRSLREFAISENALAITEYGMLIAFVALALIAIVSIFGGQISSWFARKTGNVTTV
jgi:Flp pilus assembly pilin Flp